MCGSRARGSAEVGLRVLRYFDISVCLEGFGVFKGFVVAGFGYGWRVQVVWGLWRLPGYFYFCFWVFVYVCRGLIYGFGYVWV